MLNISMFFINSVN